MRHWNLKTLSVIALTAFSLTLLPVSVFAKGGGGFGGGRSSGGFSSGRSGGGSSGFGRSFSSPSRPSYTPPRPTYTPSRTVTPSPATSAPKGFRRPEAPAVGVTPRPGATDSRGSASPTPQTSTQRPPTGSRIGEGAARAMREEKSREGFQGFKAREAAKAAPAYPNITNGARAGTTPRPSTVGTGTASSGYRYNPKDQRVRDLKRELRHERMENRELRQKVAYERYYNRPAPAYYGPSYSDPFGNTFFWLWLMDRNRPNYSRDGGDFLYHNRDSIDRARYEELLRNDENMRRRVAELETQQIKRDPSYVPPGIDRDLMYSEDVVKQAHKEKNTSSFPWGWVLIGLLVLGGGLFFFKYRWNVRPA